jgi:hypothetical protein
LPRNPARHRIQALFQNSDTRVQPVAIAVQGFDRRGQAPGLALALFGDRLNLLRLSHQIG